MNSEIFIVSCRKHFNYLTYCLRSLAKFATGFEVKIVVPNEDFDRAVDMTREHPGQPFCVGTEHEWPGKGMLWAMTQKCRADEWCPKADVIFHVDSDCVFTEPVTPETYMQDGKPILLYESFHSLCKVKGHMEVWRWKDATEICLPFGIQWETMRCHPEVYHRDLYAKTRALVEQKTGRKFDDYLQEQRNEFPQSFCEFNTLGNVAIQCFADQYHLVNLEHEPWPKQRLRQAWSHREPTQEDMETFLKLGLA